MALKNLFDMVKADRYTADGREALIKAQEAETEDKVYQIGEISQKTGLQKTANGWVKPKSGKQPGAKKTNSNDIVAQQKQKMEAEKYEAARRDAQAPSKKTEVNTPGLRKDVQEAIKRSTPEEIKEYIKELRTPGSRMSRYFDNPDLLANVYEDELNKMTESRPAAGKITSRADKEAAIRKDLGLRGENDLDRFTDEQIESMYQKTQKTPEQQKADFDKSKIGQAVNKGRQKFAAEKTRQKELASKTNAIGLPKENKTAAPVKRNEAETVKHSDGTESYRIKGTQFYFDSPEKAESAIMAESRYGKTYATPSKDPEINNIQEALGFKLDMLGSGKSMDEFIKKTGENEYAANVWGFGTNSKGTLINKLSETDSPNATIKKENGEWKLIHKDRDGKETVVTATGRKDPTRDAAPRILTGDTRIRVRKA